MKRPNHPRERSKSKLFIIPKHLDRISTLIYLSNAPTVELIWDAWNKIASSVIPLDYELKDCCESIDFHPDYDLTNDEILYRIGYLSDRLDIARCYALDYAIRQYLHKPQRN